MDVRFIIGLVLAVLCVAGTVSLCILLIKRADYIKKEHQNILLVIVIALVALGLASAFLLIMGGSAMQNSSSSIASSN